MNFAQPLTYRTINPHRDGALAFRHQREACIASFGNDRLAGTPKDYLRLLAAKVEEFPDGYVLAFEGSSCVGQLGLEVPYGLTTGYVSLYYVCDSFRGRGYGRLMHAYAERYFRSWEADTVELHVAPRNERAMRFYLAMGYEVAASDGEMWRMQKRLQSAAPPSASSMRP